MNVREQFIIDSYRLSRHAPQVWGEFLISFRMYVTERCEEALKAPPEIAHTAHGRAQSLLALRDDFQKLEDLYMQVQKKQSR